MPAIDLLSPSSFAHGQPHDQFAWLREHDPVHWHDEPDGDGFWAVTRYRDVKAIGRDPATFSSIPTIMIPDGEGGIDSATTQMMLDDRSAAAHRRCASWSRASSSPRRQGDAAADRGACAAHHRRRGRPG